MKLRDLQSWIHECISAYDTKQVWNPNSTVIDLILESPNQSSEERLQIYRGMYFNRLREALREDFKGTQKLLGTKRFLMLSDQFINLEPPRNFSITHFCAKFPSFLEQIEQTSNIRFARSMAQFEQMIIDCKFQKEIKSHLSPNEFSQLDANKLLNTRFTFHPSVAQRGFSIQVSALRRYLIKEGSEARRRPLKEFDSPQELLIFRKDFRIRIRAIHREEKIILQKLLAGHTFGEALEALIKAQKNPTTPLDKMMAQWIQNGLITQINVENR